MLCHFESHHSTVNVCEERYQEILQIFWTNILCGQNHIPWHLVCVSCIDTMCLLNMTSGQSKPAKCMCSLTFKPGNTKANMIPLPKHHWDTCIFDLIVLIS